MKRVLLVILCLVVLAICVPALMRTRISSGVAGGLGDVRGLIWAEQAYASANGGYFDEPSCLASPARCIPGYPSTSAPFLDSDAASLKPRLGYALHFHAGPRPVLGDDQRRAVSASSLKAFAIVALPLGGARQGRAFCGDSSGRLCARDDGTMPGVKDGRCPGTCAALR